MIHTEIVTINGREFTRTYSDTYTIQRDGEEFEEAVDPIGSDRVYEETSNLLPVDDEATEADYIAALNDLGVNTDEEI